MQPNILHAQGFDVPDIKSRTAALAGERLGARRGTNKNLRGNGDQGEGLRL